MTREEARKVILKMLACTDLSVGANLTADMVDACHLAIKALKQEPKSPCDLCKYNPPGSGDGKPCTMCPAGK